MHILGRYVQSDLGEVDNILGELFFIIILSPVILWIIVCNNKHKAILAALPTTISYEYINRENVRSNHSFMINNYYRYNGRIYFDINNYTYRLDRMTYIRDHQENKIYGEGQTWFNALEMRGKKKLKEKIKTQKAQSEIKWY